MSKSFILDVQEDSSGELFVQLTPEILELSGFKEGDNLSWVTAPDGSFVLSKKSENEWVLVETVSTFRNRYMVEVPKGSSEWALDTVTCGEAKEFSQTYLGETIVSHRVLEKEDALKMCEADNDYIAGWDEATKMHNFFTAIGDLKE